MKFMNMKRFGSLTMAGALALSLAAPAFAASNPSTTIEGAYVDIPISVSVTTTGGAQVNPYGLPVSIPVGESSVNAVGQQITHTSALSMRNNGTVPLDVSVKSFSATADGGLSIADTAAEKAIKLNLQVAGLDDTKYALSSENESLEDILTTAFYDDDTWEGVAELAAPDASKASPATTPATADDVAMLGASTVTEDGINYSKNSFALFRLTGTVTEEPTAAWTAEDKFTATVVFKFTPHTPVAASVTLTSDALSSGTLTIAGIGASNIKTVKVEFDPGESGRTVKSYKWTSVNSNLSLSNDTTDTVSVYGGVATTDTLKVVVTLDNDEEIVETCSVTVTA